MASLLTTPAALPSASRSAAGIASPAFFFESSSLLQKRSRWPEFGLGRVFVTSCFSRERQILPSVQNVRSPAVSASSPTSACAAAAIAPGDDLLADYLHYQSPLVKMCGMTSPEDASLAAQAGACYVGMIMWTQSKRSVRSLSAAREICAAAREFGAEPVGVFVSESAREIEKACDAAGLNFAQLHGDGARASVLELPRSLKIIYVMQSDAQGRLQTTISPEQERVVDWVLVDGLEGGSGVTFAWDNFKVPPLCTNKGWLLAGGLNPDNVANAISTLRPNAVDVASGVAGRDGIRKDPSKIFAFMQAVKMSIGSFCVSV